MNDLIDVLQRAIAEIEEQAKRELLYIASECALALAILAIPGFVPPVTNKRVDETTDDDLEPLTVEELDEWAGALLSHAQAQGGG